jgi:pimeloyl-ACP methyl ester carboxylesterase
MTEKNLQTRSHKCRAIISHGKGNPILFLHGYSYTSEIWQSLSVLGILMQKQIPFIALDMPYGSKSLSHPKTQVTEENLAVAHEGFEKVFGLASPVLVGASLGGYIALKYAAYFPVKALLLVAPARALDNSIIPSYPKFNFPIRIIWGSQDTVISGEEMRVLADRLPKAKLVIYEGATHSAYKDQPEKFKRDLLELYASAE